MIKEWFANYVLHNSDVTVDTRTGGQITIHNSNTEDWTVTLVDTGAETMTGWRIKRVASYIQWDVFMLTYGDGLSNINIQELVDFHNNHGKLATLTAVQPEWRFWKLWIGENENIYDFSEKKDNDDTWINGGFMVLDKRVIEYICCDDMPFEKDPLENIAKDNWLVAYKHRGFWFAMDTLQNKNTLESLWIKWDAPWKIW